MSDLNLPQDGEHNWDEMLNVALEQLNADKAETTEVTTEISEAIAAHSGATDPHGDRQYADFVLSQLQVPTRATISAQIDDAVVMHEEDTDPHGDRAFGTAALNTAVNQLNASKADKSAVTADIATAVSQLNASKADRTQVTTDIGSAYTLLNTSKADKTAVATDIAAAVSQLNSSKADKTQVTTDIASAVTQINTSKADKTTVATDIAAAVTAHVGASDPHGDRAASATALSTAVSQLDGSKADKTQVTTDIAAAVTAHNSATDPHGDRAASASALSTAVTQINTSKADKTAVATDIAAAVTAHAGAADPHGDRAAASAALATAVSGKADKTQVATDIAAAVTAHNAAADPHGDRAAASAALATAVSGKADKTQVATDIAVAVTTHAGASDPHGDRAYADTQIASRAPTSRQITAGTGLTGGGTLAADRSLAVDFGSTGTTVTAGNDPRLADARSPLAHAASHGAAGSDAINIAQSQVIGLAAALASMPSSSSSGWRRRDLPDQSLADSLYAGSAPTISTAQTTTPTTGYIKYAPAGVTLAGTDVVGPFTYLGAGGFQIGAGAPDTSYVLPTSKYPNTYSSGQAIWSIEFGTDAQIFQSRMKYISAATMYRLSIDGRKVTDLMQSSGGTTAGSGHLITVDLGSAAPRRIRIDFTTFPFGGVYLPPTATMWQVPSQGGRLMVFGDSLSDGSAQNAGAGSGTWFARAARLLGATDAWEQARGGTGYITPGSYATLADRLAADVIAWAPDRLIIWAGYNDNGGSQSAIKSAADSLFAAIKAGLPNCQVYVIGCWSATAVPATSVTNTDVTLRAAATGAGFPFISPLSGGCYDASGALVATHGAWVTSGNIAGYIGGDAVHPTDAGHIYLSRRIVAALRALMPA